MSEVEKMYENAGIEPIAEYYKHQCNNEFDDNACIGCKHIEKVDYPPFTAEKQLKILCFIVNKKHSVTFHDQVFKGDKLTLEKIQENLAWAINRIWKDLTEEEKEQIRSILNG